MPEIKALLEKFKLADGYNISNHPIISATGTHHSMGRRHYVYKITLKLSVPECAMGKNNTRCARMCEDEFSKGITTLISKEEIVNSAYGNPYRCVLKYNSCNLDMSTGIVTLMLDGESWRV